MNKGNSTIFALVGVAVIIVSAVIAYTTANNVVKNIPANVGGIVNVGERIFPDGIKGTDIDFETATLSSTLALTGAATLTGGATIGSSGTALSNIICVSTTTNWAAFAGSNCQWGTTTMTGITTSTGWKFSVGTVATSSGLETFNHGFSVIAYATSTNVVGIKVCNASTTTANPGNQYYEICATKY